MKINECLNGENLAVVSRTSRMWESTRYVYITITMYGKTEWCFSDSEIFNVGTTGK